MTDEQRGETILEQGGIRLTRSEGIAALTIEREGRRNGVVFFGLKSGKRA